MKNIDFAFIVHSRDRTDMLRKFPILRFLPVRIFDILTMILPPFIVSPITGLVNVHGNKSDGLVIGIPMTAHQLLESRTTAVKKIVKAVNLARLKGASFVGLGAMTASLSHGGRDVIDNVQDIYITTGRTYTIKNITEYVEYCIQKFKLDINKIKIAIVGAAGGIGSGVAISLARKGIKHFVLVDLERKLTRLQENIRVLEKHASDLTIDISHLVSSVTDCYIVIAATNTPEVVIRSEDISPGTIIINDAQPSDVSPDILKMRNDVLVIEGGVLNTKNINCHFNLGLAEASNIFSCLAETLWLTYRGIKKHHSIGEFDSQLYTTMQEDGLKLGFEISRPQNASGYVPEDYLMKFAKIVRNRQLVK